MPNMIEIHGDCVTIFDKVVKRQHHIKDWIETISSNKPLETPLLPLPSCRKHKRVFINGQEIHTFVVEQQPAIRNVEWKWEARTDENPDPVFHKYRLAMPFFVFVIRATNTALLYNSSQAFVRVAPLGVAKEGYYGPTDLFAPPIPNVGWGETSSARSTSCIMCFGSAKVTASQPPAILAQEAIAAFWAGKINRDLQDNWIDFCSRKENAKFATQALWHQETEANPFSILEASFKKVVTLEEVMQWNGNQ